MGDDRRVKRRAQVTALEAKREACEKSMASFSEACRADDASLLREARRCPERPGFPPVREYD
eukprot:599117-Pyramimonas_sp.AAC.1